MSTTVAMAMQVDPWRWPLLGGLVVVALVIHPLAAFAVLGVLLLQRAYPLDFITSYLAIVTGASFINYSRGHLTQELSLLTPAILFMLVCYLLRGGRSLVAAPRSAITTPLLLFTGLTVLNFVRGLLVDNSPRYAGLELLAQFGLASALLVANRASAKDIPLAMVWLWVTSLGHSVLGFYSFSVLHVRTGSIYYTPVPGVVAALMLAFALRARTRTTAAWWVIAMTPLLAHQFLSFTRGYWLAFIASSLFSAVLYVWQRPGREAADGRGGRLGRVIFLFLLVAAGAALAAAIMAVAFGVRGMGTMALNRLTSSTGTEYSWETSSNIVRLVEYARVIGEIIKAPLFGYGLGHTFVVREPIHMKIMEQWFTHQNYLLVMLKQGLIGLALFVWTLVGGVRAGIAGTRLANPNAAAWCAGTAAGTVHLMVYCNVHFPLAEVNTTFAFALLLGITMALVGKGSIELRFGEPRR